MKSRPHAELQDSLTHPGLHSEEQVPPKLIL